MIREAASKEYLYEPTLRPAHFGGMPSTVQWEYLAAPHDIADKRTDIPRARNRHGVIKTSRALTKQEMEHFDLKPVSKVETAVSKVGFSSATSYRFPNGWLREDSWHALEAQCDEF